MIRALVVFGLPAIVAAQVVLDFIKPKRQQVDLKRLHASNNN